MAPQLRIRQQTKGDPSGDGYKMAETSNPEKRSSVESVDSEDNEDEDQPLVCKLCSKCFTSPRRLDNHKDKCPVARKLKIENERADTESDTEFAGHSEVNITSYIDQIDPLQYKCAVCSKIFIQQTRLHKHQVRCLANKKVIQKRKSKMKYKSLSKVQKAKFTCSKCNKKFKFKKSFVEHRTQEHSELPNSLPCAQCPARCPTKSALNQHMEKVHKPASFKCPNCNAMFTRNYHVLRHMEQRGCNGGPTAFYQCKVCVSKFTRKDNLLHHLRNSHMRHNKKFQCRQCFYGVDNYNKFVKHYMSYHMESKKLVCDHCGKHVSSRVSMAMHLKSHDGKKYLCSICNYQAHTYNVMSRHVYTHCNDKPFKCDLCPSSFVQRSQLRAHVTKHNGNMCETCTKSFPSQKKLAMHMKSDHDVNIIISVKEEFQDNNLELKAKDSRYECVMCNKTFNVSTTLQKHMLTHTLDKPRRCMYCARARAYVRSDRLIKHLRDKHPDVFKQHVDVVRSQCGGERDDYINYKVTQDEIDRILVILDEFQDRMLRNGKVLYGGLVDAARLDDDMLKKADSPLMSEDELIDSLRKLLLQLIDASTLEQLGWPDEDVDVVLEKVIEQCGQRPADRDRWSRVQRLRENAKHLFLGVIEDSGIKRMLEMKTIDQVIRHILKVNELGD